MSQANKGVEGGFAKVAGVKTETQHNIQTDLVHELTLAASRRNVSSSSPSARRRLPKRH